jgi:hypothetical protein
LNRAELKFGVNRFFKDEDRFVCTFQGLRRPAVKIAWRRNFLGIENFPESSGRMPLKT